MSWLPHRWRTQRNAIRNANCRIQWIIKTLNAPCASGIFLGACLLECLLTTPHPTPCLGPAQTGARGGIWASKPAFSLLCSTEKGQQKLRPPKSRPAILIERFKRFVQSRLQLTQLKLRAGVVNYWDCFAVEKNKPKSPASKRDQREAKTKSANAGKTPSKVETPHQGLSALDNLGLFLFEIALF